MIALIGDAPQQNFGNSPVRPEKDRLSEARMALQRSRSDITSDAKAFYAKEYRERFQEYAKGLQKLTEFLNGARKDPQVDSDLDELEEDLKHADIEKNGLETPEQFGEQLSHLTHLAMAEHYAEVTAKIDDLSHFLLSLGADHLKVNPSPLPGQAGQMMVEQKESEQSA